MQRIFPYDRSLLKGVALNCAIVLLFHLLAEVWKLLPNQEFGHIPWPVSGLGLVLTLGLGPRKVLPGIILGVFLMFSSSFSGSVLFGLAITKILEIVIPAFFLLTLGGGKFRIESPKFILTFFWITCLISPGLASLLIVGGLNGGEALSFDTFISWVRVFAGSNLGILMLAPFSLSLGRGLQLERKRLPEGLLLFVSMIFVSYWCFRRSPEREFLIIPFVGWAAIRFGHRGIGISTLIISSMAILRYLQGPGNLSVDWILGVNLSIAISAYFLATIASSQEAESRINAELEENQRRTKISEDALAILDQTLYKSPIGFALIDQEFRYLRINENFARINGHPSESHIGRTISEMSDNLSEKVIAMVQRVFQTGEALTNVPFRGALPGTSEQIISGLLSYYPISSVPTGEIFGVAISFQNVSELFKTQNLLRENQERLAIAQDAGKMGAFEWCLTTDKVLWNKELENIYGLEHGEFGGVFDSWMKLIHPSDRQITRSEFQEVCQGIKELNHQFRVITKDSSIRWILARGKILITEGNRRKLIGINIDLTEQKNYEQQLRLTEANLLHALSVRDEFVGIASHELKTPLTALKLQFQMFQRSLDNNNPEKLTSDKLDRLLVRSGREVDRLTRLVDDMLDISRLRTGKLSLRKERCQLNQIVFEIFSKLQDQFTSSGSGAPILEYFDEAFGDWDPLRIEQVITNIVTNALRYGQGRPIILSVKNYHDNVRITVKDNGLGIPKSDQIKIFQRYEKGLLRREISGLGLGLFISHQIVEAHGGKIWVESELHQGATFFVDLPRVRIEAPLPLENAIS